MRPNCACFELCLTTIWPQLIRKKEKKIVKTQSLLFHTVTLKLPFPFVQHQKRGLRPTLSVAPANSDWLAIENVLCTCSKSQERPESAFLVLFWPPFLY